MSPRPGSIGPAGAGANAPELCRMSARALARLIYERRASIREIAATFLDRIEVVNPHCNAIVSLRPRDDILADAEALDAALARGEKPGPLYGLPHAVKDLVPAAGLRTTFGSPLYADFVPLADAPAVTRLRQAGALIIGKTNTAEFGLGSHTDNPVFGPTRNAYDPSRTAGGSSGGAAVAVAMGMTPLADGSDFAGSVRNPAAYNNLFGFRPSLSRSIAPDAFFMQLGCDGALARTVEDLALLLSVQTRGRIGAELLRPDIGGGRIAWLGDLDGRLAMESGVLNVCERGLVLLTDLGCTVEPAHPPFDLCALWRAFVTLGQFTIGCKLKPLHHDPDKRLLLSPAACWEIEGALSLSACDLYAAAEIRAAWLRCLINLFEAYDFVALPAAQVFPFPIEDAWPRAIAGRAMDSYHRWMESSALATMAGCPAISLPAGFGPQGLPMGVQIIGPPQGDDAVLQLARAYEQVCPWLGAVPAFQSPGHAKAPALHRRETADVLIERRAA